MSTDAILLTSVIVSAPDQVSAELEGETVVLSLGTGVYYGLNEVAARILTLAAERCTIASVVDALLEEYEVARDECEMQVVGVVREMRDSGLLEVHTTDP